MKIIRRYDYDVDPGGLSGVQVRSVQAARWCALPPAGTLLTVKEATPNRLASLAVLYLRGLGYDDLSAVELERIADTVSGRRGPWPGPVELTPAAVARPIAVLTRLAGDQSLPLDIKVERFAQWITTGACPGMEEYRAAAEKAAAAALRGALVSVGQGVAVVQVYSPLGFVIGMTQAPVVVAEHPAYRALRGTGSEEPHRHIRVGRWSAAYAPHVDWHELARTLTLEDPAASPPRHGWACSDLISISSPHGISSAAPLDRVADVVRDACQVRTT